ncbi:MAG: DeoR/GlpR family DNA-binding transcription regulator [Lentisphaeria bacterium]
MAGKFERTQGKILQLLRSHGHLHVVRAAAALGISEATVRRHLTILEQQGLLLRVHGGCRLPVSGDASTYLFQQEAASRVCEKCTIGEAAARLFTDCDRLFFDSGTTVLECGHSLCTRLKAAALRDVHVVTNSLAFGASLAQHCPVVLTGGNIRPGRMDLAGMVTLQHLERYHYSKAVLGADGIAEDGTLTTTDEETSLLATAAVARSQTVLILADSSKLGRRSFVPYSTLQGESFTLITDNAADPKILENLKKRGIKIILAPPAKTP